MIVNIRYITVRSIVYFALVCNVACTTGLTPKTYLIWFQKNAHRFSQKITRGDYTAEISYIPLEYTIAQHAIADTTIDIKMLLKRYASTLTFVCVITDNTSKPLVNNIRDSYAESLSAIITNNSDTIKAIEVTNNSDFNEGNFSTFVITFNKNEIKSHRNSILVLRNVPNNFGTIAIDLRRVMGTSKSLKGRL
jgi:hypothetical protein